jgi:hypothetical protein
MMRRTIANPRPAPSRLVSPRQNRSKIFSRMCSGTPGPLSSTSIEGVVVTRILTAPPGGL